MCLLWPAKKKLVLTSLNTLNGKVQGACMHFPATVLQIPALWPTGAGELSGSDSAGSFWPEPVLRTYVFHLRADRSEQPDRTK